MGCRILLGCLLLIPVLTQANLYKEPITTRQGYIFTIKLASAPTTGLDWFFGNDKELRDYVQLVDSEFVESPSLVPGRIGKKVFTFKALKNGKVVIKMIKRKAWEDKEIDHTLVKVNIRKADFSPSQPR